MVSGALMVFPARVIEVATRVAAVNVVAVWVVAVSVVIVPESAVKLVNSGSEYATPTGLVFPISITPRAGKRVPVEEF
jgi:hypothetical protein